MLFRSDILPIVRKSTQNSASILAIIAAAGVFSYLINRAGVPAAIGQWIAANIGNGFMFLLCINIVLFMIGMFLETSASIIILAPILVPAAIHFGVDPVHFGLVMIVNLALGMITPPFGVNLFAACEVAKVNIERVIPTLLVFVGVVLACLMVITYVPTVSLFLLG